MPAKYLAGQHIRLDRRRQSRMDARELALLEIGVDPKTVGRHQRKRLRPAGSVGPGTRAAIPDAASHWGSQFGIIQVELCEVALGNSLFQGCSGLLFLCVDDIEPALRCGDSCTSLLDGGDSLLVVGIGLLKTLHRGVLVESELSV